MNPFDRQRAQNKRTLNRLHDNAVRLGKLADSTVGGGGASIATINVTETVADADGNTLYPALTEIDSTEGYAVTA